ncbi:methylated-DNA--[protein]-cysteine S-methyltransferase [Staphylococcus sp. HMSC13A10]|uniref:methylated-DNA--[protein]-cysteine S-methyltransferase n=1 Tax=Staphylococcus sp. HMSC13A10 TaxID=1581093 RepID=UPI0008A4F19B|nr:methylated-DNA--[protein]-cysteine S-methyltransferase [Staphylococcus sp. HMSC13A10]OFV08614.1 cysteine methyltransferase [Staphylococcus sp. HMSC13A10]
MEYKTYYDSPVGLLELVSDGEYLTHVLYQNQQLEDGRVEKDDIKVFQLTKEWLDAYFKGDVPNLNIPTKSQGTEFQQFVWQELEKIEYGELTTYGDIAQKVATRMNKDKMSAQAVGGAVGSNPISIIIPCHRVVAKNGSLTGYGGTIKNKVKLLETEKVDMSPLFVPKHSTKP